MANVHTMPTSLRTQLSDIEKKRGELADIFKKAKDESGNLKMSADDIKGVNDRNDELNTLTEKYEGDKKLWDLETANSDRLADMKSGDHLPYGGGERDKNEPNPGSEYLAARRAVKSLGEQFVKSEAFTKVQGGRGPSVEIPDVSVKTLLQTTDGYAPETTRSGLLLLSPQRPLKVVDLVPKGGTSQIAIVYMEETLFTNTAAETAEGGLYPEAALRYEQKSSPVRKIAVYIPVTDEQLADVPQMRSLIENRLGLMIRQRLDTQILNGNGTGQNLRGVLNTTGILAQAKATDNIPDAFFKAITKVRTTSFADPDAIVANPLDWQTVRLMKTTDGLYIWGNPADVGPMRMWGLPVVDTTSIAAGAGVTGDFSGYTSLDERAGIEFEISNSHADNFTHGILAIRAQMRAAFTVRRPQAFCGVTGLNA